VRAFFPLMLFISTFFSASVLAEDSLFPFQIEQGDQLNLTVDSRHQNDGGQTLTIELQSEKGLKFAATVPAMVGGKMKPSVGNPKKIYKAYTSKMYPNAVFNNAILFGSGSFIFSNEQGYTTMSCNSETSPCLRNYHAAIPSPAASWVNRLIREVGTENTTIVVK